uniref:F-BAR and double SH3 domains protein 2 n=1 Tax=Cacopsylla melanoneura TaxID=428564 RepID=A0A8D8YCV8_9HEMI
MQPPPRKGNYVKFLKNLHTEQIAKLQLKNQNECDLLDDIRNFILKKSAIEKSYAEALLKISSHFLNKKIANIPDVKTDSSEDRWNMWNVWRTVLEENEKLSRARMAAIEVFQSQIADEAKMLRLHKLQAARKYSDQLANIQKDVQASVQDVDKNKKLYFDEEHCAHDVRDKARDIEEKLKKKKGSFFQSITSLQKNSAKVSSKKDMLEEKSSGARNDYLLSLAAANAHQTRYFVVDFQGAMQAMEANVYERVSEYLTLISRTELLTCSAHQTSFTRIRDQANQLTREYNMQCVYLYYPVLKQHIQYEFEPCDNDTIDRITADHPNVVTILSQQAKRWATRAQRETFNTRENNKKIVALQALKESGQKNDPNDPNGPDIDTKIEELKQAIRRSETGKVKAEARLECLKAGDVNVEEWLADMEPMEMESLTVQEQDMQRSASSLSMRTDGDTHGSDSMYDSDYADATSEHANTTSMEKHGSEEDQETVSAGTGADRNRPDSTEIDGEWAMLEQERQRIEQMTAGWDDPTQVDWGPHGDEEEPAPVVPPEPTGPVYKCIALYSYTAQNPDELSIVENEQLEVIGDGDGDGWLRARNYKGEEGFVPHNYLDVDREENVALDNSLHTGASSYQLTSQISFSSVDYTVDENEEPNSEVSVTTITTVKESTPGPVRNLDLTGDSKDVFAVALYDYEATCPEELNLTEGQVLKILRKIVHDDVDDGWWEGQLGDQIGLFPSLVVEECRENGEPLTPDDDETPPPSAPPVFTPPDAPPFLLAPQQVTITHTQPTPCGDRDPNADDSGFAVTISKNQKEQYDTQFSEDEMEAESELANEDVPSIAVTVPTFIVEVDEETTEQVQDSEPTPPQQPEAAPPAPSKAPESNIAPSGGGGGLGVASIVITAATPCIDDAGDKAFPPPPPPERTTSQEEEDLPPPPPPQEEQDPASSPPSSSPPSVPPPAPPSVPPPPPPSRPNIDSPDKTNVSIPDELDSTQLEKLSELKESNA